MSVSMSSTAVREGTSNSSDVQQPRLPRDVPICKRCLMMKVRPLMNVRARQSQAVERKMQPMFFGPRAVRRRSSSQMTARYDTPGQRR